MADEAGTKRSAPEWLSAPNSPKSRRTPAIYDPISPSYEPSREEMDLDSAPAPSAASPAPSAASLPPAERSSAALLPLGDSASSAAAAAATSATSAAFKEAKASSLWPVQLQANGASFREVVQGLSEALSKDKTISGVTKTTSGYLLRTFYPLSVQRAAAQLGWTATITTKDDATRTRDYTIRGVPTAAPLDDLKADLAQHLGCPLDQLRIRRLHASTEGAIDRERPIPVIVASVRPGLADRLQTWRIFGSVPTRADARPRKEVATPQCQRCFAWGHRAGACTARRRCAICGGTDHLRAACPKRPDTMDDRRCFQCGERHFARYAGCPARREEERRVREALAPRPFPPASQVTQSRSFRDVAAAAPPPQPQPQRTPRADRRTSNRFELLQDELGVTTLPEPQAQPPASTPPHLRRQQQARELARKIAKESQTRDHLSTELERVEAAQTAGPHPELLQRCRQLRARLRSSRSKLLKLNADRLALPESVPLQETSTAPQPQPPPGSSSLGQLLHWAIATARTFFPEDSTAARLLRCLEDFLPTLLRTLQCL